MIKRLHDEYVAAVDCSLVHETGDQVPSSESKRENGELNLAKREKLDKFCEIFINCSKLQQKAKVAESCENWQKLRYRNYRN